MTTGVGGYASAYADKARLLARPASKGNSPKLRIIAYKENTMSDSNVKSIRYHFFLYASMEIDMNNFACAIDTG